MAAARTGTGKTAGFTLPILQTLSKNVRPQYCSVRALIIAPTRELASQTADSVRTYGKYMPLKSTVAFGGSNIRPQISALRSGIDILTATPGRLLDLHNRGAVNFRTLEILVLDEADRMLDMGFIGDIKRIVSNLPAKRQTLMFSATFSKEITKLAETFLKNPVSISVSPPNTTVESVKQSAYKVNKNRKSDLLIQLIKDNNWERALVFSRTKRSADKLARKLKQASIPSDAIHGDKSQSARTKTLLNFKRGRMRVLVATDVASRGIDIAELPQVVNYDMPHVPEDYVHRIGRTGRAGAEGEAVSFVSPEENSLLSSVEFLIKKNLTVMEHEGFDPGDITPLRSHRKVKPLNRMRNSTGFKGRRRVPAKSSRSG
ncbi:MAG: DEAD/DEAH box helicase [Fibrobacterota bacterium]